MSEPIIYGKVIVEEGYRDGKLINRIRIENRSIAIRSKQELLPAILSQLENLGHATSVCFEVFADSHTHEPTRIVVVSKQII